MVHWMLLVELVWCFTFTWLAHVAGENTGWAITLEFISVLPITITACKLQISNDAHDKLLKDVCAQNREAFVETCKKEGLILDDATNGDFSIRFFTKTGNRLYCHEIDSVRVTQLNMGERQLSIGCDRQRPETIIAQVYWDNKTVMALGSAAQIWGENMSPYTRCQFESLHSKVVVVAPILDDKGKFLALVVIDSSRDILNPSITQEKKDRFTSLCEAFGDRIWRYYSTVKHIHTER